MKRNLTRLTVTLIFLLAAAFVQAQNNYYINISNNTGYTVYYIYVSPASANEWGGDLLGDTVLMDGETFRVDMTNFDSPTFDIRLVDEDGDSYTFMGIDTSTYDLNVTLADLD